MSGPLTRHADQVADAGRSLRRRALALLLAVVLGGLLIQFGSRCDLYLPLAWTLTAKPGDKVRGGETIVARRAEPSRPGDSAATGSQP